MANKDVRVIEEDLLVKGRVVAESFEGGFGAFESSFEKALKNVVSIDEEDVPTMEVGGNLKVDGKVQVNGTEDFVDHDGNPIVFNPMHTIITDNITVTTVNGTISIVVASGIIPNTHIQLFWEVESSGIHFGGDVILHPFDTLGNVCFVCGRFNDNGTIKDFTATLDEDGTVSILLIGATASVTEENIKVHWKLI